jgi:tyrosine-protein kinase
MTALEPPRHHSGPAEFLAIVRRRRWLVLLMAVLVPVSVVVFSLRQRPMYEATAKVLLSRQNLANSLTGTPDATLQAAQVGDFDRYARTQASLAHSPIVASRVLRALKLNDRTRQQLVDRTTVRPQQSTDILDFAVTDPDADLAPRLAAAYAKEFTDYRLELDTHSLARAQSIIDRRIAELARRHDRRSGLYQALVEKQQELATLQALQTSNALVVFASRKAEQVTPRPVRNGLLGFAIGVVLGVVLAFLREALETRVRSADEVRSVVAVPLLAHIPPPPRRLRKQDRLVTLEDPSGPQAETFRMLRTSVALASLEGEPRVVMVTSAVESEGKSTTAANLAITLARAGRRVVLLDCDFRRPYLHRFFAQPQRPGLSELVLGDANLDDVLITVPIGEQTEPGRSASNGHIGVRGMLEVVPAGTLPPNPGEFVATPGLGALFAELRDRADHVIIDAPPMLHVTDAISLSPKVDALLLVVRLDTVRRSALREARRLLDSLPTPVLGFAATGVQPTEAYGYAGYYAYGEGGSSGRAARDREPLTG